MVEKRQRIKSGAEKFPPIKKYLDSLSGFWDRFHTCLDEIGLSDEYVESTNTPLSTSRKFIKDNVWGMMEFSSDEMTLIDCPLVQRLRGLHQLGFSYLIYPSAEHSRFAHTLGVTHVTKSLLRAVQDSYEMQPTFSAGSEHYELFNPSSQRGLSVALVHAAILHDIGHVAFSHAGESAIKSCVERMSVNGISLLDLIYAFRDQGITSDLSEIMSLVICLSPRFEKFHKKIYPSSSQSTIFMICSFISGVPHDDGYPGLANIISGANIDADKIDYINRDARATNVPAAIDISRVFLNTSLIRISSNQAKHLSGGNDATKKDLVKAGVHFAINSSGIDTYDEIATSKSQLYHRVYLHQATRNVEQMLSEAITAIAERGKHAGAPAFDFLEIFPLNDAGMLDFLLNQVETRTIARRISLRQLPKRAFVIYRDCFEPRISFTNLFDDDYRKPDLGELDSSLLRETSSKVWQSLVPRDPIEEPERIPEFVKNIREGAVEARSLLDKDFSEKTLSRCEPYVGYAPRVMLKSPKEVLVREKNAIARSIDWTKSEELTKAENIFKAIDYIYCDEEWLRYVRLSCIRLLHRIGSELPASTLEDKGLYEGLGITEYEVQCSLNFRIAEICSRIGADYKQVCDDLSAAQRSQYLGDAHHLVPLQKAQVGLCNEIAEKFKPFVGERGWVVSNALSAAFIRQFPVDLRDDAIELILNAELLDRTTILSRLGTQVAELKDAHAEICICGLTPNSGSWVRMLFEADTRSSLKDQGIEFARGIPELEAYLADHKDALAVFVDDQFYSGSQCDAQLHHWMGKDRSDWPEDIRFEKNIDQSRVGKTFVEHLRNGKTVFAFVYGTDAGVERVEARASALGISDLHVSYGESLSVTKPTLETEMESFLSGVGKEVLKREREIEDGDLDGLAACERDALGYSGAGTMVFTPFNSPTHAITALWCPGTYSSQPWIPLLLRRGYRRRLVFG